MHPMPTLKPVAATASKQSQSMQYDMFCDASRVCSRGLRAPQLRVPSVSRAFRGARLPAPSYSFGDGSHTTFYQPVTAGSSKPKQLRKRIKQQQKRLKELSHGISSTDISPASIHTLLTEMREMNDNLAAVTKVFVLPVSRIFFLSRMLYTVLIQPQAKFLCSTCFVKFIRSPRSVPQVKALRVRCQTLLAQSLAVAYSAGLQSGLFCEVGSLVTAVGIFLCGHLRV